MIYARLATWKIKEVERGAIHYQNIKGSEKQIGITMKIYNKNVFSLS